jgi:hypothetical protein
VKIDYSRKALQFYRWIPDQTGGRAQVDDDALVHAVLLNHPHAWERYKTKELRRMIAERYLRRDEAVTAVCGRDVRVVYPMAFDTGEDEACAECKGLLATRGLLGEEEFARQLRDAGHRQWRLESERRRRRQQKAEAQQSARDLAAGDAVASAEEPFTLGADHDETPEGESDKLSVTPEGVDPHDNSTWMFPELHKNDPPSDEETTTA